MRFAFGGAVTALAGIIAQHYGPEIGGLFLAFPAIFPATATLIERHEKQKKKKGNRDDGNFRARVVTGVDAAGTAMGAVGLVAFAVIAWRAFGRYPSALVLTIAAIAWLVTAVTAWRIRKYVWGIFAKPRRLRSSADSKRGV